MAATGSTTLIAGQGAAANPDPDRPKTKAEMKNKKKREKTQDVFAAPLSQWTDQDEDELPRSEWSMVVDESGPELPPTGPKGAPQAFQPLGQDPPTTSQKRSST